MAVIWLQNIFKNGESFLWEKEGDRRNFEYFL